MLTGRKKEIGILKDMLASKSSELIAVYGRRRIGKTFLIRETFRKSRKGITRKELLKQCKFGSGGVYSRSLDELIESTPHIQAGIFAVPK